MRYLHEIRAKYLYEVHVRVKSTLKVEDIQHTIPSLLEGFTNFKVLMINFNLNYIRFSAELEDNLESKDLHVFSTDKDILELAWAIRLNIPVEKYNSLEIKDIDGFCLEQTWGELLIGPKDNSQVQLKEDYYKLVAFKQLLEIPALFRTPKNNILIPLESIVGYIDYNTIALSLIDNLREPHLDLTLVIRLDEHTEPIRHSIKDPSKAKSNVKLGYKVSFTQKQSDHCCPSEDAFQILSNKLRFDKAFKQKQVQCYLHKKVDKQYEIVVFDIDKTSLIETINKSHLGVEAIKELVGEADKDLLDGVIVEDFKATNIKAYQRNQQRSVGSMTFHLEVPVPLGETHSIPSLLPELVDINNISKFSHTSYNNNMFISFNCSKDHITIYKILSLLDKKSLKFQAYNSHESKIGDCDMKIKLPDGIANLVLAGLETRLENTYCYVDSNNYLYLCDCDRFAEELKSIIKALGDVYFSLGINQPLEVKLNFDSEPSNKDQENIRRCGIRKYRINRK